MSCVAVKIIIDKGPAPDLFSQLQDVEFNEREKYFFLQNSVQCKIAPDVFY